MIGLAEIPRPDGGTEMVQIYENEYDIPNDFPRGDNVAFESPVVMNMQGQVGWEDALIVEIPSTRSTVAPLRVVVPRGVPAIPTAHYGINPIPLADPIITPAVIIAVCVMIAVITVAIAFIYGQWVNYHKSLLVAHSGDIVKTVEDDLNGDGINDVRTTYYQNGREVVQAISDYGVQSGVSVNPEMTVDPTWGPDDLEWDGIFGAIGSAIKVAAIGVVAISLIYIGSRAYQSYSSKQPYSAPLFEQAGGMVIGGAKKVGKVASSGAKKAGGFITKAVKA